MLNEESNVIAIVPMKPLSNGKSRLARTLTEDQRAEITLGMLRRVLKALNGASISTICVIGGDDRVKRVARDHNAICWTELGKNLNDTLSKAMDQVFMRDKAALYVAGDLPFLKPSDIHSMLQASRRLGNVTLAPARRDGGTNAILVPRGVPFRPELGRNSFKKHLSKAAKLKTSVAISYSPGLGFDLDIIDDLRTYQHMEPGLIERLAPSLRDSPLIAALAESDTDPIPDPEPANQPDILGPTWQAEQNKQ
jgi:2-phospho-L-lactate guanylyltransferase